MDTNLLATLRAKSASLRSELQSLEEKKAAISAELARLETAESVFREMTMDGVNIDLPGSATQRGAIRTLHRTITKREEILNGALELMESGPKHTEDILDALIAKGVSISGDDRKTQLRNVSAYLSKAKDEIGIAPTKSGWVTKGFMQALHEHQSQPRE